MNKEKASNLMFKLRCWDTLDHPYIPYEDTKEMIMDFESLSEAESNAQYGDHNYLYAKVKLHADHHSLDFEIPEERKEAVDDKIKAINYHTREKRGDFKGPFGFLKRFF